MEGGTAKGCLSLFFLSGRTDTAQGASNRPAPRQARSGTAGSPATDIHEEKEPFACFIRSFQVLPGTGTEFSHVRASAFSRAAPSFFLTDT